MIGKTINNYVIERKLGEGGMGNVYFARHNRVDRMVAIKILHQNLFTNENIRNRFKNEANALIKLGHPNIVKIYDYVEQDNFACLVMEYIEGYTLDDYITKVSGPLVSAKAIHIICNILDAVQYAHDNNIFHRDIKPGNIMVSKDGTIVRIMDFGIAKLIDADNFKATKANTQLGTPFYMSPEQVKGLPYTASSDIYSLGVTLYEMVTGKCPYQAITNLFELQSKIVNEPLPPTSIYYPDVPLHLQAAIIKATQKDPSERFRTCTAFKDFLLSETKPKTESSPRQAVKKNTKSQPAQPVKSVTENKTGTAIPQPVTKPVVEVNKISAPNLLAAYPAKEKKKKTWVFVLLLFSLLFISGSFYYLYTTADDDGDGVANINDKCPDVKGTASLKGCPDTTVVTHPPDTTKVIQPSDTTKVTTMQETTTGTRLPDTTLPPPLPPDRDGDGIVDNDDKCPDKKGEKFNDGCPFTLMSKGQIEKDVDSLKLPCSGQAYAIGNVNFTLEPPSFLSPREQVKTPEIKIPIKIRNKNTNNTASYKLTYQNTGSSFRYIGHRIGI